MRIRKIVYSLEYDRASDNFMFMSGESKCVMFRYQLKPEIRKYRRDFFVFWLLSAA